MKESLPHDVLPWTGCAPPGPGQSLRPTPTVDAAPHIEEMPGQILVVSPFNSLHNGPELVRKDQEGMNG